MSLRSCAKKLKTPPAIVTAVRQLTDQIVAEGKPRNEAELAAAQEYLNDLMDERAELAEKIEAKGGVVPKRSEPIQESVKIEKPEPAIKEKEVVKSGEKIEDFGEKLQGAKKDLWQSYKDKMQDSKEADIASVPLSKSWPEPDYQALIDNGADPYAVAFAHAARDEVPTKPQKLYKIRRWVEQVTMLRDLTYQIIEGNYDKDKFNTAIDKLGGFTGRIDLYQRFGHEQSFKGIDLAEQTYSMYDGVKFDPPKKIWEVYKRAGGGFGNWPKRLASGSSKEEAMANFAKVLKKEADAPKKKVTSFNIYTKRHDPDGVFIGKKIGRNYIDLKKFTGKDAVKEARAYLLNNAEELEALLEKAKEIPNERRDTNRPRVGVDMRNAQDVTPEMFQEAFGFRGVQFGNYVEKGRRQQDLNNAYDALMDMAAVLEIPPKALSLNGELGLAFGARGSGGVSPAAAHYERGTVVINLTKMNGAGSLGHEWWHALDNYFARAGSQPDNYATTQKQVQDSSRGFPHTGFTGVRNEMIKAFGEVVKAVRNTEMAKRAANLDSRRSKEYWGTTVEMTARAFEAYLIAKLQDQNASNDYLANILDEDTWNVAASMGFENENSYPYPTEKEMKDIRAGYDYFFNTIESRETGDGGVILFSKGNTGKGMSVAAVEVAIAEMKKNLKSEASVSVLKNRNDLPELIRDAQGLDDLTSAVYANGRVFLFADKLVDAKDARVALAHELIGHKGVLGMVDQEGWNEIKRIIRELVNTRDKLALEIMLETNRRYGTQNESQWYQEFIALAAERRELRTGFADLWAKIKAAVRRALKALGIGNVSDADLEIILEDAETFLKSQKPARGASTFQDRNLMSERAPTFYSALLEAARGLKQAKGSPEQMIAMLKKAPGVKQEEMDWLGVEDFAKGLGASVTKQQLVDFIEQNGVQVQPVVLGEGDWAVYDGDANQYFATRQEAVEYANEQGINVTEDTVFPGTNRVDNHAKYSKYQLPGGENYREVLLTLPAAETEYKTRFQVDGEYPGIFDTREEAEKYTSTMLDGFRSKPEFAPIIRRIERNPFSITEIKVAINKPATYKSGHWDQPNVLAHIRLNDRTNADGRKVLFVEEIQSDWHQEGRREGYAKELNPEDIVLDDVAADVYFFSAPSGAHFRIIAKSEAEAREKAIEAVKNNKYYRTADGVPDAPFKNNAWAELSIKQILRIAAEGGYDAVAWTTGEQQAARYDLSKHISKVVFEDNSSGGIADARMDGDLTRGHLYAYDLEGTRVIDEYVSDPEKLADYIGKEAADRLINAEPKKARFAGFGVRRRELSGLDLKVGGEGMKSFYDRTLPNLFKSVARKLDKSAGVKLLNVKTSETLPDSSQYWIPPTNENGDVFVVRRETDEAVAGPWKESERGREKAMAWVLDNALSTDQNSITITDAMRQGAMAGQPLFSKRDQINTPEFKAWFKDSKVVDENGEPLVVYHGTRFDFDEFTSRKIKGNHRHFFASDPGVSSEYGRGDGHNVMPVYLSFKNPFEFDNGGSSYTDITLNDLPEYIREKVPEIHILRTVRPEDTVVGLNGVLHAAEAAGHDGVIATKIRDGGGSYGEKTPTTVYVAFSPEQIKSAIGNRGTFDPSSPNILQSRGREPLSFGIPDDTLLSVAIRRIQDKFKPLKDLQASIRETGGIINDDNDAYLAEELFHSKAENDIRMMQEAYIEPLSDKMTKFGISRAQLDQYLYARHAPERNKYIASINPQMPDGGSGMTDLEAKRIISEIKKSGKLGQYDQLSAIVDDLIKLQRDMIVKGGLEDDGLVAAWQKQYQHYIPLKGWADDTKDQGKPRTGQGFNIGGRESKRAMGRTTEAASPVSYAIVDLTEKMIRRRKNEVGNALLKMAEDNPNPDFWSVYTDEKPDTDRDIVKVPDGMGGFKDEVREVPVPMRMMRDRYFQTKRDGKVYFIKLKDDRLMNAMKNLDVESIGAVIRTMAGINRVLSALYTAYAPEFLVSNFARDVQTAILNLQAEQSLPEGKVAGKKIASKVVKDIPKAMKAIWAVLRDQKATGEWEDIFKQFRRDGAQTGYFDMKTPEEQGKALDRMVEIASGSWKGNAMKWANEVGKFVENANRAVENAVRLAAYKNAIDAGISRKRAASLAKNMTVNFNRRGEIGTVLNAMYMFANASIQGTANFVRTMGTLKGDGKIRWENLNNAQKIAVGITAASFFLAMANRMSAGDDDDEVNWYDKVPDYVKERNLVIMKSMFGGERDGSYWKIPLPYGYNVFNVLGVSMESVVGGEKSTLDGAKNVTLAALGSFSPIGFQDSQTVSGLILKNAAPTVAKPVVDLALNENYMGSTIYTENLPFSTPKPESSLGRRSTPEAYKKVAEWLNSVTGGSEHRSGAVDINPDVMQYVLDYMGGSAYSFFGSKVPDYVFRTVTGVEKEINSVPFVSRIAGRVLPYDDQKLFYERRDEINQLKEEYRTLSNPERARWPQKFRKQIQLQGLMKNTEEILSAQRKRRNAIYEMDLPVAERDRRIKEVEVRMKAAVDRFNKAYNEAK